MASHDAGVAVVPLDVVRRVEPWNQEQIDLVKTGLRLGEGVPQMVAGMATKGMGVVGIAGSAAVSVVSGQYEHGLRYEALKKTFGALAADIGKTPDTMEPDDWKRLAERYPMLQQHLEAIDHEANIRPRDGGVNAAAGAAGMVAGQLAIPIPIVGGLIGGAAAGMLSGSALKAVDSSITPDETGIAAIEGLSKAQAAGVQISREDVFRVMAIGTPELKTAIEEQSGQPFVTKPSDQMTAEEKTLQAEQLKGPKAQKLLLHCQHFADAINNGQMTAETLIRVDPAILLGEKSVQIALRQPQIALAASTETATIAPEPKPLDLSGYQAYPQTGATSSNDDPEPDEPTWAERVKGGARPLQTVRH